MNFRYRFAQFMQGRNGPDSMLFGLTVIYVLIAFINLFIHSAILYFIGLVLFFYGIFRFFSRNITKRSAENLKYLELTEGVRRTFSKCIYRIKQNKVYCFKRCPNCGKTLRLPRKRGRHTTCCPLCKCNFAVHVWMGDK